jgi:hypothetical protein
VSPNHTTLRTQRPEVAKIACRSFTALVFNIQQKIAGVCEINANEQSQSKATRKGGKPVLGASEAALARLQNPVSSGRIRWIGSSVDGERHFPTLVYGLSLSTSQLSIPSDLFHSKEAACYGLSIPV